MKKLLSVILAVLIVVTCSFAAFVVFAEDAAPVDTTCHCANHNPDAPCHCCVYCPNLDKGYLTSCVQYNENGEASFCCSKCTGIWPCTCGCDCCNDNYAEIDDGTGLPILTPDQQDAFIGGFQGAMAKVAAVFDRIFNAIMDFLRIEEVFPDLFN